MHKLFNKITVNNDLINHLDVMLKMNNFNIGNKLLVVVQSTQSLIKSRQLVTHSKLIVAGNNCIVAYNMLVVAGNSHMIVYDKLIIAGSSHIVVHHK